ncbi:hypothetical protein G7Y89_g6856 [Cudoniella acicularis]|uniref:Sec20 C-terminal domain-containing protein n=1 Tax=Cudoniella acicularis TaxID=354080 RepID=A0A8H4W220_9HELO|nr:hypothetical protein G7Y89_g6856 [Cudoniella acicularis]
MSFEAVSQRLTALLESKAQLKDLINRLATIKFQPGSIPLDNEEGNAVSELTLEIQQTLKDQDEDFEILQEEVLDLNPGRPGSELEQQRDGLDQAVKRAMKELKICQSAFRKSQLAAKRNLQEAQRAERELLIQSYINPPSDSSGPSSPVPMQQRRKQNVELSKEEREVNASSDVTAALRRTHDMMASELSRSQFANDTLKESTAALAQLSETYSTLDTLLSSSRNLLGTLLRSQKSDTWYLETAFYILLATIAWLVFRRILYGPTLLLLWFPKMFIKGFMAIFAVTGLIGGSSVKVLESSSVVSPSLVTHRSATGRLSAPSGAGPPGMGAPSINVGGGGRGAPMRPTDTPSQRSSMSEQVGRIIDDSNSESAKVEDQGEKPAEEVAVEQPELEESTEPRNPKKRMWEEDKEAVKEEQRKKDEL